MLSRKSGSSVGNAFKRVMLLDLVVKGGEIYGLCWVYDAD